MRVLHVVAPVGRLVCLAEAQLLLVQLGFLLLLAATKPAKVMRGTFIGSFSTLVISFSATSSCPTAVGCCEVTQWSGRGYISRADDFGLPSGTPVGGFGVFGGRQGERGRGTVEVGVRMVMCRVEPSSCHGGAYVQGVRRRRWRGRGRH